MDHRILNSIKVSAIKVVKVMLVLHKNVHYYLSWLMGMVCFTHSFQIKLRALSCEKHMYG